MRPLAAVLALALLPACTDGGGTARPSSTTTPASATPTSAAPVTTATAPPDPGAGVTMTVATRTGGPPQHRWTAQVPTLRGLPAPAVTTANAVLTAAVDDITAAFVADEKDTGEGTAEIRATLSAADDRYVTVELFTYVFPEGAAHGFADLETYVFARGSGQRLDLAEWFRPASRTAALRAMGRYLKARVPQVVGDPGFDTATSYEPDPANFADVTPLPEGLEVTFGSLAVAPNAAGLPAITVPWRVLDPYLVLRKPAGDREPAYRDGRRLHGDDLTAVRQVVMASREVGLARGTFRVDRVQQSQWFGAPGWALATLVPHDGSGPHVVALREEDGRWQVVDAGEDVAGCADLPADVRESVALACG